MRTEKNGKQLFHIENENCNNFLFMNFLLTLLRDPSDFKLLTTPLISFKYYMILTTVISAKFMWLPMCMPRLIYEFQINFFTLKIVAIWCKENCMHFNQWFSKVARSKVSALIYKWKSSLGLRNFFSKYFVTVVLSWVENSMGK